MFHIAAPLKLNGDVIVVVVGEVCNFVAYAFVQPILVTPLGALSVVIW